MDAPFAINPDLTAIAVAYRNRALIADEVLPRTLPVGTQNFNFTNFPIGEGFTIPDTRVGRRGAPNVVEFGGTQTPSRTDDYGLEDEIPQDDIDQAANARTRNPNLATPQAHSTEMLSNLIALDREVRVANLVFNPATYGASNKVALTGTGQWSDPASTPDAVIMDALEGLVMRPNVGVIGRMAWNATRRNARIVQAINKTTGNVGAVSRQDFADFFELDELLIGDAFFNTAKPGQSVALSRAWGKHAAFFHRDKLADRSKGVTFGLTVPYGTPVAADWVDNKIGMRGGVRVRVGESVKELITAADAGYFFQNCVA